MMEKHTLDPNFCLCIKNNSSTGEMELKKLRRISNNGYPNFYLALYFLLKLNFYKLLFPLFSRRSLKSLNKIMEESFITYKKLNADLTKVKDEQNKARVGFNQLMNLLNEKCEDIMHQVTMNLIII